MQVKDNEKIVISGSGLFVPDEAIANQELVDSFNSFVESENEKFAEEIELELMRQLEKTSALYIERASGIKNRYVVNKNSILNIDIMHPLVEDRPDDQQSLQCEMSVTAIREALDRAGKYPQDVNALIVACSNMQRAYPAIAIEVQQALGFEGYSYDMNVACSSAPFAIQAARNAIACGSADVVVIVNPEICTGHLNFRDKANHFIFGDACSALIIEKATTCRRDKAFEITSTKLSTKFSNNIRNNFGFLSSYGRNTRKRSEHLFRQNGRRVLKEVVPFVTNHLENQLQSAQIDRQEIKRLWLHQANLGMNRRIAEQVLKRDVSENEAPVILDEYGNTSSAGSVIAFHKFHDDFVNGDIGILCAYGAGYSTGSVVLKCATL